MEKKGYKKEHQEPIPNAFQNILLLSKLQK